MNTKIDSLIEIRGENFLTQLIEYFKIKPLKEYELKILYNNFLEVSDYDMPYEFWYEEEDTIVSIGGKDYDAVYLESFLEKLNDFLTKEVTNE